MERQPAVAPQVSPPAVKPSPSARMSEPVILSLQRTGWFLDSAGAMTGVEIGAGTASEFTDYVGPAVFHSAKADKTTVEASGPKPKAAKWAQNEVQVSVESEGANATAKFSLVGEGLGCSVDASGLVKIGDTPGTITVRAGGTKHYDEVAITITAPPKPAGAGATGLDAGPEDEPAPIDAGDAEE